MGSVPIERSRQKAARKELDRRSCKEEGCLQSLPRMLHNPFVFFGRGSQPLHNGIKHSGWMKYLRKAGIRNLRWHDLRHTFASRLVMRGVDLYTVSKLMGHHSMERVFRKSCG